jgi:sporulation-control protein
VVLEADKRGSFLSEGHDSLARYTVAHDDVAGQDWNTLVDGWIQQLVAHRADHASYTGHGYDGLHGHHHGRHGHDHDHSGPGVGTAVAAGAAGLAVGVVGGMVAAEVVDEVGDFFEGDEEEEG